MAVYTGSCSAINYVRCSQMLRFLAPIDVERVYTWGKLAGRYKNKTDFS